MPQAEVVFYKADNGDVPVWNWLRDLRRRDKVAFAKLYAKIELLAAQGHELRRPSADFLRDGIHELRAKQGRVNLRILYFFHNRTVAVLAEACTKEDEVPAASIDAAIDRRERFIDDPLSHTYTGDQNQ